MRLVLHIGRHKTGTTAIQAFLSSWYDGLCASRILYPLAGRRRAEGASARIFHHDVFIPMLSPAATRPEHVQNALAREIEGADPRAIILSSEVLSRESVTFEDLEHGPYGRRWSSFDLRTPCGSMRRLVRRATMRVDRRVRRTPLAPAWDRPAPLTPADRNRILAEYDPSNTEIERRFFDGATVFPRSADGVARQRPGVAR